MRLVLRQSDDFWADLQDQVDWYRDHASSEVAERYVAAVEATLTDLAAMPRLGRPRFHAWPELAGVHSWRVQKPFQRHLIFYRFDEATLWAERVIPGARDLPRRLRESPFGRD